MSARRRDLFQAKTRIGRLGNLIQAVSIFDIYFAMDAGERFDTHRKAALYRYANQIGAIEAAKQRWRELRATKFTPAAIAAALIPPGLPRQRTATAIGARCGPAERSGKRERLDQTRSAARTRRVDGPDQAGDAAHRRDHGGDGPGGMAEIKADARGGKRSAGSAG